MYGLRGRSLVLPWAVVLQIPSRVVGSRRGRGRRSALHQSGIRRLMDCRTQPLAQSKLNQVGGGVDREWTGSGQRGWIPTGSGLVGRERCKRVQEVQASFVVRLPGRRSVRERVMILGAKQSLLLARSTLMD
ncbi:hypothetical protein P168DRAFT_89119 [Aspergillus campestris IBT 28561]|uniref:Secreted protein n=1 Tax=Aspergillus campestris (strain IBT 28561) TaxID=1392248 RepID=A0A2I1DB93_ASPC2|nr:uncharacterized protein P168DRAFT_89119 [Aspergillus campestris IBT 28561]PKY07135.1 hypothetical protein P168DRAFT_89119 [Aspergillus campestris IBT 28561]